MSRTKHPIHAEKLPHTITKFYSYMIAGWIIDINPDGKWRAQKEERRGK